IYSDLIMNYSWNITIWMKQHLSSMLRKPKRMGILISIVSFINGTINAADSLYKQFNEFRAQCDLRVRYSCETKSLENLLNSIFGGGIYLTNPGNSMNLLFGKMASETATTTLYGKMVSETLVATQYGYVQGDFQNYYTGRVTAPLTLQTAGREVELRSWI